MIDLVPMPLFHNSHFPWRRRAIWLSDEEGSLALSVDFADISMHAIATDPSTVDRPCLYVQLSSPEDDAIECQSEESDEEGHINGEEGAKDVKIKEIRLIPENSFDIDSLFQAFCEGAERNPDTFMEEEGQGSLFFDQSAVLHALDLQNQEVDTNGEEALAEVEDDDDDLEQFADADDQDETNGGVS